jgi:hypothetical protein
MSSVRWFGMLVGVLVAPVSASSYAAGAPARSLPWSAPHAAAIPSSRLPTSVTAGEQAGEILGFEPGEERHYTLGPDSALERGEAARWSIRLDEVAGSGRDLRATFILQHEREAPRALNSAWSAGEVTHAQVDATLVVNGHGAPLELTYVSQRHIFDVGDEVFQVVYRFAGDKVEKRVALQGAQWDLDIDFIEHVNLDPAVPIGLFAFSPASLDCMEWLVGTVIEHRTGTGTVSPGGAVETPNTGGRATVEGAALAAGTCYESNTDPAFANPGLASLAMPLLWERRGDSELVLFSPLRPDLVRGQGNGIPLTFSPIIPSVPNVPGTSVLSGTIPGLDLSGLLGGGGTDGDRDRARDPQRYFFPRRMRLSERQRIDVGDRKMDALPMQVAGYSGSVWVDDWGKVLRLDVPPLRVDDAQRWVRLLHSSEY